MKSYPTTNLCGNKDHRDFAITPVGQEGGAASQAHFSSPAGVYLVYYLVLDFLTAADLQGCYGDERALSRQDLLR